MAKYFFQFLIIACCLLSSSLSHAAVQASVDRAVVYDGESFTLTISSDSRQRVMPDLSLLEKDFQILGTGSSQQVQVINGVSSAKTSWTIRLQAKGPGQFHIPSLRVDKELTNPIQVTVSEPPVVSAPEGGQHAFVEVVITSPEKPVYLQQQVLYTVRLLFDLPLLDGSLSEPAAEHALIEQLGEDSRYTTQRNGRTFQVIERRYAIFPEKSGSLELSPLRFKGRLETPAKANAPSPRIDPMLERFFGSDPFSRSFDRGIPITLQSKSLSMDVLPRPADYQAKHWLPAASLELEDSWASQPPEFKMGEPVSRTITVRAKGLLAPMLPPLELGDVQGASLYPEQPQTETRTDGNWVYAQSRQSISYMPTRAGQLKIPELTLSWWDTEAAEMRTAELPGWNVEVLPGTQPANGRQPANDKVAADAEQAETSSAPSSSDSAIITKSEQADESAADNAFLTIRKDWLLVLLLVLAVIVVVYRRYKNRSERVITGRGMQDEMKAHDKAEDPLTLGELKRDFKAACSSNDARAAAAIILKISAAAKPGNPPQTLPALAEQLESGRDELYSLDRFLYTASGSNWDGEAFYQRFKDGLVFKQNRPASNEGLAPLYPE